MLNFPQNPQEGDVFQRWVWDGDKWVTVAGEGGTYLPITGGTMFGNINLYADASQPMQPTTLRQVEAMEPDLSGLVTDIFLQNALAAYLPLSGGTMSGPITLAADGSGSQAVRQSQMATAISTAIGAIPPVDLSGYLPLATGGLVQGNTTVGSGTAYNNNYVSLRTNAQLQINRSGVASYLSFLNQNNNEWQFWDNGATFIISGYSGSTAVPMITLNSTTGDILLGKDATADTGAVTLQQVNAALANYLALGGGSMSGPITLNADASGSQAVRYSQMTTAISNAIANIPPPSMAKYDPVQLTFSFAAVPSSPPGGATAWGIVIPIVMPLTIPAGITGWVAFCNSMPAAAMVFDIRTFAQGSQSAVVQGQLTLTTGGAWSITSGFTSAINLAPGDVIGAFVQPDTNVGRVGITLQATRV